MRRLRLRITIKRMMLAIAVVGIGTWAFAEYQRNGTYYAAGWWDAELELWRGEATIFAGGGGTMRDRCWLDAGTGLPMRARFMCVIYPGDLEWVKGHDDHIAQYIRWHGLPKNTLKPWAHELFNLRRYFDDRSRTDMPSRLLPGEPAVVSPDARNSVQCVAGVRDNGSPGGMPSVIISAEKPVLDEVLIDEGDSDLFWGPDGSRFAVIRSVHGKREHYAAYYLITGRLLREETWQDGKQVDWRKPFKVSPSARGRVYADPYDDHTVTE